MRKLWLVAAHEYRRHVLRPGFLVSVFGLPALFIVLLGTILALLSWGANQPVGVVDLIALGPDPAVVDSPVPLLAFATEADARAALDSGVIQAALVLDARYLDSGAARLLFVRPPAESVSAALRRYVRLGWLQGADAPVVARFAGTTPYELEFVSLREDGGGESLAALVFPYAVGMIFYFGTFTTAGYLLQSVVDEKENRTIELMLTSLGPGRFMAGKIAGLCAVGATQIGVWMAGGAALYGLARSAGLAITAPVSGSFWLVAALWLSFYYLFICALIAAIGVMVAHVGEAQQLVALVSIVAVAPLGLIFLIVLNPDSALSVGLTLFPLTAPFVLLMRWQVTTVPAWQLGASGLLLALAAGAAIFVTGRLLRVGLLRTERRLGWREAARLLTRGA